MISIKSLALGAAALCLLWAVPQVAAGSEEEDCTKDLGSTWQRYNAAFDARDLEGVMDFYHPSAVKIDPSGDYHDGRQAIGDLFGELFQMEFTSDFQDVKRTVVGCRTAMQVVNSTLTFPELGDYQERFMSVLTFTRDAGKWRVLVNASSPQS